jgi:hypothetical protein
MYPQIKKPEDEQTISPYSSRVKSERGWNVRTKAHPKILNDFFSSAPPPIFLPLLDSSILVRVRVVMMEDPDGADDVHLS